MNRRESNLAFIDLLFNMILGFVFLFIIAFLMINDPKKEENLKPVVEYMIILTWSNELDVDIDLWVHGPAGRVGFQNPDEGFMYLDKDDLGHRNDTVINFDGSRRIAYINREVVNIRGFDEGEYTVNAHYYGGRDSSNEVDVEINVVKLNPFIVVFEGVKKLKKRGDEETMIRFSMDKEGNFFGRNRIKKSIVYDRETMMREVAPFSPGGP